MGPGLDAEEHITPGDFLSLPEADLGDDPVHLGGDGRRSELHARLEALEAEVSRLEAIEAEVSQLRQEAERNAGAPGLRRPFGMPRSAPPGSRTQNLEIKRALLKGKRTRNRGLHHCRGTGKKGKNARGRGS